MKLNKTQLQSFGEDGFVVIPELFSMKEIALMRSQLLQLFSERCAENFREKESNIVRTAMGLHLRNEVFARVVRHPRLLEPATQLLGEDMYIQQVKVNAKEAFSGEVWQWHYDFATHHGEDGVPKPLALNLHIFLDDVNEFNGPLTFIRGSHKYGPAPTSLDTVTTSYPLWTVDRDTVTTLVDKGGLFSAKGPAGTALIFGDALIHSSSINLSPWPRQIFSLIVNPVSNALTRYKRPEYQHHRDLAPVTPLADDCLLAKALA